MKRSAVIVLLAFAIAACGKTTDIEPVAAGTTTFPATIAAENGSITIAKKPVRIVSLSPTATETLFAIGAGRQVVAVDDQSNYPAAAPRTKLSGYTPIASAFGV